jgi:hypothetical protein
VAVRPQLDSLFSMATTQSTMHSLLHVERAFTATKHDHWMEVDAALTGSVIALAHGPLNAPRLLGPSCRDRRPAFAPPFIPLRHYVMFS